MKEMVLQKEIATDRAKVWAVLADFPNIAAWNSGVRHSEASCDIIEGVGAERICRIGTFGRLDEKVTEWVENQRMVVDIHRMKGMPMKRAVAAFELSGDSPTTVTLTYRYQPSLLGSVMSAMIKMMLRKGFRGFLDDLGTAATS